MKWLHHLLKGFSLTGALFVFQACYGTPQIPDGEFPQSEVVAKDTTSITEPVVPDIVNDSESAQ